MRPGVAGAAGSAAPGAPSNQSQNRIDPTQIPRPGAMPGELVVHYTREEVRWRGVCLHACVRACLWVHVRARVSVCVGVFVRAGGALRADGGALAPYLWPACSG